jgi:hypothetical protein
MKIWNCNSKKDILTKQHADNGTMDELEWRLQQSSAFMMDSI